MQFKFSITASLLSVAVLFADSVPTSAGLICGGAGQDPCGNTSATYKGEPQKNCKNLYPDDNAFFDPRDGGECWSCPSGFSRNISGVDSKSACISKAKHKNKSNYTRANFASHSKTCKVGFKATINGGECRQCPTGFTRTKAVKANKWNSCHKKAVTSTQHNLAASKVFTAIQKGKQKGQQKGNCPRGWRKSGGKCYQCQGGYKRTASGIQTSKACVLKTTTKREHAEATFLRSLACPDGQSYNSAKKACVSCPAGYSRFPLGKYDGKNACILAVAEVTEATYLGERGCGDGLYRVQGGCWSCPKGYSRRKLKPIKGPNACKSDEFRWQSPQYNQPSLYGLKSKSGKPAFKNLVDHWLGDEEATADLKVYLLTFAIGSGLKTERDVLRFIDKGLEQIRNEPQSSLYLKSLLYAYVIESAARPEADRNKLEKDTVDAMQRYIRASRICLAEEASTMYDAWLLKGQEKVTEWKEANPAEAVGIYYKTLYETIFNLAIKGKVSNLPPDFKTVTQDGLAFRSGSDAHRMLNLMGQIDALSSTGTPVSYGGLLPMSGVIAMSTGSDVSSEIPEIDIKTGKIYKGLHGQSIRNDLIDLYARIFDKLYEKLPVNMPRFLTDAQKIEWTKLSNADKRVYNALSAAERDFYPNLSKKEKVLLKMHRSKRHARSIKRSAGLLKNTRRIGKAKKVLKALNKLRKILGAGTPDITDAVMMLAETAYLGIDAGVKMANAPKKVQSMKNTAQQPIVLENYIESPEGTEVFAKYWVLGTQNGRSDIVRTKKKNQPVIETSSCIVDGLKR